MLMAIDGFKVARSIASEFPKAFIESVIMVVGAGLVACLIGLILASLLVATKKDGVAPNQALHKSISGLINLLRSIPGVILVILMLVVTRAIVGVAMGLTGAIIPLILVSFPVFTRQIENALLSVDEGVVEASVAMGLKPRQIIFSVYIREAIPRIINGVSISLVSLLAESTVVGMLIGAGGLGDMAVRYGLHRQATDVAIVCVVLSLLLVLMIQTLANIAIKKSSHIK